MLGALLEFALNLAQNDIATSIVFAVLVLVLNRHIEPQPLRIMLYAMALASLTFHLLRLFRPEFTSMLGVP
jgi:hypothetical protein